MTPDQTTASNIEWDWLGHWARKTPEREALVDAERGQRLTYGACDAAARHVAAWLANDLHVSVGDRVACLALNGYEIVILFFATQRLGAILVPLNYRLAPPELDQVLADAEPRIVFATKELAGKLAGLASCAALPIESLDHGPHSVRSLVNNSEVPPPTLPWRAPTCSDPCMILYTSGTTGRPKGVIVTFGMIYWNSVNTALRIELTASDATVGFLPFFHTGAWNVLLTPLLHHGGRVVLLPRFDPEAVLRLVAAERTSILFGVPTTMAAMAETTAFATVDLSSVRFALVGGEAMPEPLIHIWEAKGIAIRQGYGLTEFGPNVFSLPASDSIRKIGSIGLPNHYCEARILHDDRAACSTDEVGELVLRGPVATPGYWRQPEATAALLHDGWCHTGDLVRRDAEGYYYVVGRKKEMYISGGENVYPAEIERVLRTMPGIRDAAVIGIADGKWGEVGCAFLVKSNSAEMKAERVLAYCRNHLAGYKIPRRVVFVDELPKGDNGKILKRSLRAPAEVPL